MPKLTPKQHRIGLAYADRLAELAAGAPDDASKRDVYRAMHAIRQRYGWSDEDKKDEIVRVVHLGASHVGDIVRETRFNEQDVKRICGNLVESGRLRKSVQSITGGNGRPPTCFFPADEHLSHP
jgi:hypothetical protein